jgi:tetratricopeptide (TPR) repeat protein
VEALLRKYPKTQLVKALKAFCAAHLNKVDVAEKILDELIAEGPEDDRVLHTMTFVYKALGDDDGMLSAYLSAVEKRPDVPEIHVCLFGHYVKHLDYIHQQHEAFKLAKIDPTNADMYCWWSICSLVMQSCDAVTKSGTFDDALVDRLLLLAQTMMLKRISAAFGKVTFEQLMTVCDIFCGMGKHDEALSMCKKFDAVCKDKIPNSEEKMILGTLMIRTKEFEKASEVFLTVAQANPRDWVFWHLYIATVLPDIMVKELQHYSGFPLPLGRIDGGLAEKWDSLHMIDIWEDLAKKQEVPVEDRIARVEEQLQGLASNSLASGRPLALAKLEVAKYKFLHSSDMDSFLTSILEVIPGLAVYASFGADLRHYIKYLDENRRERVASEGMAICQEIEQKILSEDDSIQSARKAHLCLINGHMLLAEAGYRHRGSWEDSLQHALGLIDLYFQNTNLVEDFDPKDRGIGEDLLVLAVMPLINSMTEIQDFLSEENTVSKPWHMLLLALVSIEAAQVKRTVSAPLRLAASALYGLIGAESLATKQFAALDIKGVLHDSLTGHWMLPIISCWCADTSQYQRWFGGIVNLHTVQEMEAREALFSAYEQETYTKVPEFVDFIDLLDRSATSYMHKSELEILRCREMCLAGSCKGDDPYDEDQDDSEFSMSTNLAHNDDLTVRPFWYPPTMHGSTFDVLSWWETFSKSHKWEGLSSSWWSYQYNASSVPSERTAWEVATDRHLLLRRQFPAILHAICGSSLNSEGENRVFLWLQEAFQAVDMEVDLIGADILQHVAILESRCSEKEKMKNYILQLPGIMRMLTVLVGLQIQQIVSEDSKERRDGLQKTLKAFGHSIQNTCEVCSDLLNEYHKSDEVFCFSGNSGTPLLSRLAAEELIWASHLLQAIMKHTKQSGQWDILHGMRQDFMATLDILLHQVSQLSQHVSKALEAYPSSIKDGYRKSFETISSVDFGSFDVDKCLQNIVDSQLETMTRISRSLQGIKKQLEYYKSNN